MGWDAFELCRPLVISLQKDPDPEIRRVAQHVMSDAFQMKSEGTPTRRRQAHDDRRPASSDCEDFAAHDEPSPSHATNSAISET
jgi:hypothetical protein